MSRTSAFLVAAAVLAATASAQQSSPANKPAARSAKAASKQHRTADGHPDLSGIWTFAISIPPGSLTRIIDGKKTVERIDRSARYFEADIPGTLPWTKEPLYKPEFREKVAELAAHESKVDPVFYCGRAGVPRVGSPRRIVQLPNEFIFFYEEISGDAYRFVPVNAKHHPDFNPSYWGDAVGRWEGDTLVVETKNFVDDSWFGEEGYIHSDAMKVTERFWRVGDNLAYQVTVDDPKVLMQPWTNYTHLIEPSDEPLQESPPCKDDDGPRLLNLDHHVQR